MTADVHQAAAITPDGASALPSTLPMADQPAVVDLRVAFEVRGNGARGDVLHRKLGGDPVVHAEAAEVVGEHQGAAGGENRHGIADHRRVIPLDVEYILHFLRVGEGGGGEEDQVEA